jgi:hypothetical protein
MIGQITNIGEGQGQYTFCKPFKSFIYIDIYVNKCLMIVIAIFINTHDTRMNDCVVLQ